MGHWPDEPSSESDGGAFRPALSRRSSRSPTKKAAVLPPTGKKKKKPTVTIPVVDTMQRRSASGRSTPVTPANSAGVIPATSTDVWTAYASLTETLAEIVPRATPGYFKSYLHSGDYDSAHEATLAALNALAASNARLGEDLADEAWQIFEDVYGVSRDDGNNDISDALHACIGAAEGDVMSVMDLMNVVHDLRFWPDYEARREAEQDPFATLSALERQLPKSAGTTSPPKTTRVLNGNRLTRPVSEPPQQRTKQTEQRVGNGNIREAKVRAVPGSKAPAGSASTSTSTSTSTSVSGASTPVRTSPPRARNMPATYTQGFAPSPVAWTTVNSKKPKRGPHPLSANIPAYARGAPAPSLAAKDPEELTPAECYARGAAARRAREDAMRAAGRHFRSGQKHIQASVAGHYAAQAREAATAAREWELRGARLLVDEQLESRPATIDLHYMSVEQAVTIAKETASRHHSGGDGGTLIIITGKGIHSAGNRGVLGPAVQRALTAEGYRVTRQEGYLAVRSR